MSGAGKSTIANGLEHKLRLAGRNTVILDGDVVRQGLCKDLGFSAEDRKENIRRVSEVAHLLAKAGIDVITAFISPFRQDREATRQLIGEHFIEVFVDAPVEECEKRDPKGLYEKARAGLIQDFTGIDSPYEAPESPDIHLRTTSQSPQESVSQVLAYLKTDEQSL